MIAPALLLACLCAAPDAAGSAPLPSPDAGISDAAAAPAVPIEPTPAQVEEVVSSLAALPDFRTRLVAASERFLGVPYLFDPLGEGTGTPPDEDPRLRFDQLDCQTFLETVLALARAKSAAEVIPLLDDIRYLGSPAYAHRNHFFEGQWVPANTKKGFVRDATFTIAGRDAVAHVKVVTRERWDKRTVGERSPCPRTASPSAASP
ncbi:MAG: DUF1460 domain-containing protein [Myxococcales bacterium]